MANKLANSKGPLSFCISTTEVKGVHRATPENTLSDLSVSLFPRAGASERFSRIIKVYINVCKRNQNQDDSGKLSHSVRYLEFVWVGHTLPSHNKTYILAINPQNTSVSL